MTVKLTVAEIGSMNTELARFLEYLRREEVDEDDVFDSRLVSCELITNAIRHCGSAAFFTGTLTESDIKISVCAKSPGGVIAVPPLPDVLSESGRGLYIVNAVSHGNVVISGGTVTVILKRK